MWKIMLIIWYFLALVLGVFTETSSCDSPNLVSDLQRLLGHLYNHRRAHYIRFTGLPARIEPWLVACAAGYTDNCGVSCRTVPFDLPG